MNKKVWKALRKTFLGGLAGFISAGLIIYLSSFSSFFENYFDQFENVLYDLSYKFKYSYSLENLFAPDTASMQEDYTWENRIEVVDIDERSLAKLGQYSHWPRSYHGKVVEQLTLGGAAAITFDILFKNADFGERNTEEALKLLKKIYPDRDFTPGSDDWAMIRSFYNYDSVLVSEVAQSDRSIVCALMANRNAYPHKSEWSPISSPEWQKQIGTRWLRKPQASDSGLAPNWDLLDNIFPELAQAAERVGLVNVVPDRDGIQRSIPLFHGFPNPELYPNAQTMLYPIVTLQTVLYLFGTDPDSIEVVPGQYINLGAPLGIYRDSTNTLRTTFQGLTIPMLRKMQEYKEQIKSLKSPTAKVKKYDVAPPVMVQRKEDSTWISDVLEGQRLYAPMMATMLNNPSFLTMAEDVYNKKDIDYSIAVDGSGRFVLSYDDMDDRLVYLDEENGDEVYLDRYTLDVIQANLDDMRALAPGQSRFYSTNLSFIYDMAQHKILSNLIVLQPDVIDDIFKLDLDALDSLKQGQTLRLGDPVRIPIDERNRMQINFVGLSKVQQNRRAFKQISYYDVIAERIDPMGYQGKIFVLGSTAPALFDFVSAPHEAEYPAVMIHATLLENILNRNFLEKLAPFWQYMLALAVGVVFAIIFTWLSPVLSIILMLFSIIAYFFVSYSYFEDGLYLGMALPGITLIMTFLTVMVLRYLLEEREKRFLNASFKNYISPELIDQMLESGDRPSLGGQESFLTAYFTDIAQFSTFSEKIGSPSRLVELLNEYLTEMTNILLEYQGTLDKYEGDAIIAFFGAPVPLANHAQQACEAALEMQKRLLDLRKKWSSEGDKWPEIVHQMHMRIGINSGSIVTGNMGSSVRMNYTMMGDAVNLAARLESGAKQYGVYSMCSIETLENTEGLLARIIDKVRVVGKSEPVVTCELLAIEKQAPHELKALAEKWEKARELYEAMDWDGAIKIFSECDAMEPFHPDRDPGSVTTPSQIFIARCEAYKETPPVQPGEEWDGVYTATSK